MRKKGARKQRVAHSGKKRESRLTRTIAHGSRVTTQLRETHAPERIPILSYFTGAGLLDIGFLDYNFDIVWRNEYHPPFIEGFEYGMAALLGAGADHRIHNTTSVTALTPQRVANEAFHNTGTPATFGIIGGPPCPDFSNGGKNLGGEGDHGKLTELFVSHILMLLPSFFLLENVIGLHKTAKHKLFLDRLISRLDERYDTSLAVLNALEYGVPQNRERVFLVGFKKQWLKTHLGFVPKHNQNGGWFPWPAKLYIAPKDTYPWPGQVPFGSEPEKPEGIPDELMVGTWICDPQIDLETLPNGLDQFKPKSDKFYRINEGDDTRKSFKRLHRWRYSPAAAYGNNEVHLHPMYPRRLSVREVMRIQSVPNGYALPEHLSLTSKFKMIGNGVPVGLARAVAGSFDKILSGAWVWDSDISHKG